MSTSGRSCGGRALAIAGAALAVSLVAPASGLAVKKFGADLRNSNGTVRQPNVSINGDSCHDADSSLGSSRCTRVAVNFDRAAQDNKKAPRDGRLKKLKLVASGPGQFVPYLARARDIDGNGGKARLRKKGATIHYDGDHNAPYTIESFPFHQRVKKGDYLGIKATRTSALSCTSGGVRQLLFEPPLPFGGSLQHSDGTDDCVLLLQAVYRR